MVAVEIAEPLINRPFFPLSIIGNLKVPYPAKHYSTAYSRMLHSTHRLHELWTVQANYLMLENRPCAIGRAMTRSDAGGATLALGDAAHASRGGGAAGPALSNRPR